MGESKRNRSGCACLDRIDFSQKRIIVYNIYIYTIGAMTLLLILNASYREKLGMKELRKMYVRKFNYFNIRSKFKTT